MVGIYEVEVDRIAYNATTGAGIVHDSQGNYHFPLALTIPGRWLARFVGSGVLAGASQDVEIICDPPELA